MSWNDLYAFLVVSTGMSWEEVRWQLDFPRLEALSKYWASMPPVHIELARIGAHFGVERPKPSTEFDSSPTSSDSQPKESTDADMMELFNAFPMR